MQRRRLKCTVELQIQAITCPGVLLPSQEEIYLSVRILDQFQKTHCVPAAFPLLFHTKMVFTKSFSHMVDPSDVADLLESDSTLFELIQLIPAEGEILATLEENSRAFLYPGPRELPAAPCAQRELLMKKSITFPGISPKIEFSTITTIEECGVRGSRRKTPSGSPLKSGKSPIKSVGVRTSPGAAGKSYAGSSGSSGSSSAVASSGYDRPTVASLTRAPSPYTQRKMCQLSEDARQRLCHLQLGPHAFRKETRRQPPFVVPHTPSTSMLETSFSSPSLSLSDWRSALSRSSHSAPDASHLSCRKSSSARVCPHKASPPSPARNTTRSCGSSSPIHRGGPVAAHSTPLPSHSLQATQSPVLSRSSLRERFQSDPSSPCRWEEIHRRVERLLRNRSTGMGARCQLTFDGDAETDVNARAVSDQGTALSCDRQPPPDSQADEPSVHLDNGHYWSSKAAAYTGKSHRVVFEESMGKIYKNLYRSCLE
ncbi:spermatogenesis-associated protein 6 isoform X2 [Engraulis encrasicolus]|uniref:spermatogenesis-associated protein 6 isoform X2 n=1 Tax=Engraulis encrasicolus TaxID=184585 RepID=UPI002FCFEE12